jgi:aspartate/methionine/tyrosine aminotransferase
VFWNRPNLNFLVYYFNKLPPYLFFEIRKAKEEAARRGLDIIDLGEGDPDQPTYSSKCYR